MANTVVVSSSLLAAAALVLFLFLSVCMPTSEAAPFFVNMPEMSNLIQMPDLPRIQMPDIRLPEIDPATMIENGGQAVARTGEGVIVMFENGMAAFMRTSTGLFDGIMRSGRSLMDMFGNAMGMLPIIG